MKDDRVKLTAPWADSVSCIGPMEDAEEFVRQRSRVHSRYITEENKTKRIRLGVSTLLGIGAVVTLIFAPVGVVTGLVACALGVGSASAAGVKKLGVKSQDGQLVADSGVEKER